MAATQQTLSPRQYDAVIFDLDGVVTRTARLHAAAWKAMFDAFLTRRGEGQAPFDPVADYRRHVDGKPRYDGVRSFLAARGIELPHGSPGDPSDRDTVCGLGNRKNDLFMEMLDREGAAVFASSLAFIRALREAGVRTAVVSSSRNCVPVLESVGALALFDAKVDGLDAERLALEGKPAPDIFLAAARQLGVRPERAVVVEDAQAGVQAGKAGRFGLVVGVDRASQADALRAQGADLVVTDLAELAVEPSDPLPSALASLDAIAATLGPGRLALFLDYDGTLTPVVERPDLAVMAEPMRAGLRRLAGLCSVAVVSGRDLEDVRQRVGVEGLHYAGSHGLDIAGPEGGGHAPEAAKSMLPELDQAEIELRRLLAPLPGVLLERKRFGLAIHYRQVEPERVDEVKETVDGVLQGRHGLRKQPGKKVVELLPDLAWDKGAAVNWLLQALDLRGEDVTCMYLGDDLTDEAAFKALPPGGIGIVVMDEPRPTAAAYRLKDVGQVSRFLDALADRLEH